ncbi:MAG: cation:proton antiporter, partial [Candidatus Liptonbacteria bacterium]
LMNTGLFELAALVVFAAVLGVAARLLRQPIILAYLLTGAIVGYFGIFNLSSTGPFQLFADLGIMFLLFLVGLEINYTSLRLVGGTALTVGLLQVLASSSLGFGLAVLLGFSKIAALYLGAALSFSSTIVVVKLLSEKKDLGSLYGKIAIGILLVQDVIAILLLVVLGGVGGASSLNISSVAIALAKGLFLFGLMLWLGRSILPFLFDKVARSRELLFLISLAWVFLVAAAVSRVGFSIEIAGLLAGLALANSAEHFQIAGQIRSLRDFFILIFFVILGSSLINGKFGGSWWTMLVFSVFVMIITPLVVMAIMGLMGYRKRTAFFTGLSIGQISEFSLILVAIGGRLGHISLEVVSLVTGVAIITIVASSYFIGHANKIYRRLRPFLNLFERAHPRREDGNDKALEKPYILVGANRVGESIARHLPAEDLLVIEFDPDVIQKLKAKGIEHVFGDMIDPDMFDRVNFSAARLVISTSPDLEDNLLLLEELNHLEKRPKVVVRAENESDADALYEAGADYVLFPHFTSGQYLGKTLAVDPEMRILENLRVSDMEMMGKAL